MHFIRCVIVPKLKNLIVCNNFASLCRQTVKRDGGHALVTTLGLGLCTAVIAGTLQTMVMFQAETLRLYDASRQAYWLARGAAMNVLATLQTDPATVSSTRAVETAGWVVKENVSFGVTDSVRIEASVRGVHNVVVFSYDPNTRKVTEWQDNSP